MNTSLSRIAAALLLASGAAAPSVAAEYDIDPSHSFVQFRASHLGFSWVVGRFNEFSGSFEYDANGPAEAQSAQVDINVQSLDSNHAERDRHLLSDDFLSADEYPDARFESTSFAGDPSGGVLDGNLTLHGTTRPVQITLSFIGEGEDPWGGYRAGFEGRSTITGKDFGIEHRAVSDIELDLFIEGIRK